MGRQAIRVSKKQWENFFTVLEKTGNISGSARASSISYYTVKKHRREDPEFDAAVKETLQIAVDRLEEIAWERAGNGSDTLLMFLLNGNRPEKYRRSARYEIVGDGGGPVTLKVVPGLEARIQAITAADAGVLLALGDGGGSSLPEAAPGVDGND